MKRSLVIITYHFAPVLSPGSLRMLRWGRYLPQAGWHPVFVACSNARGSVDPELMAKVRPDSIVHRVPAIGAYARLAAGLDALSRFRRPQAQAETTRGPAPLSRKAAERRFGPGEILLAHLFMPDHAVEWVPGAVLAARRALKSHRARLILTTSPPHSTHLVGLALKLLSPEGLAWVADFRDPWYDNAVRLEGKARSRLLDAMEARMERWVVEHADLILANTAGNRTQLQARYPELPAGKVVVLPNGYDPEDFREHRDTGPRGPRMTFLHVGYYYSVFGDTLFRGFEEAIARHPELAARIRLRLVGELSDQAKAWASYLAGLDPGLVDMAQPVPHHQAIRELGKADVLVCTNYSGEQGRSCVPSKLYEYVAAGKPILLVSPPGDACELVERSGLGHCIPENDRVSVAEAIWRLYCQWQTGSLQAKENQLFVRRFRADEQAELLASFLDQLDGKA